MGGGSRREVGPGGREPLVYMRWRAMAHRRSRVVGLRKSADAGRARREPDKGKRVAIGVVTRPPGGGDGEGEGGQE